MSAKKDKERVQVNSDFNRSNNSYGQEDGGQSVREVVGQSKPESETAKQLQAKRQLQETIARRHRQMRLIEEQHYVQNCMDELRQQLMLVKEKKMYVLGLPELKKPLNLKAVKIELRKQMDLYYDQIGVCICILKGINQFATNPEPLSELLNKCEEQLSNEFLIYDHIGDMNEPETKSNLLDCVSKRFMMQQRYKDIEKLLEQEQQNLYFMLAGKRLRLQVLQDFSYGYFRDTENSIDQLEFIRLPLEQLDVELAHICVAFSKLTLDDTYEEKNICDDPE